VIPILIDTHFWLWLVFAQTERAGADALHLMNQAASAGKLLISVISIWEVAMLVSKNRLDLGELCESWIADAIKMPGLTIVGLTPEIAVECHNLPGNFHSDPADRIIIATARRLGARLLTADRAILEYAAQGHLALA
jgi:PIN domain nuclease of toxin-antitoxin system